MKTNWINGLVGLLVASTAAAASAQNTWDQPQTYGGGPPPLVRSSYFNPANTSNNFDFQEAPQDGPAPQAPSVPQPPPYHGNSEANGVGLNAYGVVPQAPASNYGTGGACDSGFGQTNGFGNRGYFNHDSGSGGCTGDVTYGTQKSRKLFGGNHGPALFGGSVASADCNVGGKDRNIVVGVGGLVFFRDYEDDVGLSGNGAGEYLFSTSAQNDALGGLEAFIQSRGSNGRGFEARYWGLYPNCSGASISNPWTSLGGLSQIYHGPSTSTVQDVFNRADSHEVCRENRIHNLELNRLINAGTFNGFGCRAVNYEFVHGARWFEFDEYFEYNALSTGTPTFLSYNLETKNTLLGYQFGGRSTRCISDRFQLTSGVRFGLYNNRIRHRQQIVDENDYISYINSGPSSGRQFDYSSSKNDLSTIGEADLGLGYLLSSSVRLTIGYRLIGVTGVALAPDQIPYNFTDANELRRIDSNGSLLLHGVYGGLNYCF
jgi:Putative beta barrel porin-7 (BBP7)